MVLDKKIEEAFARISPKWAELYKTYKFDVMMKSNFCEKTLCRSTPYELGPTLSMSKPNYCVLGEAYNFQDSNYGNCELCRLFSYAFDSTSMYIDGIMYCTETPEEFERTVVAFVKHFQSEHKFLYYDKLPDL